MITDVQRREPLGTDGFLLDLCAEVLSLTLWRQTAARLLSATQTRTFQCVIMDEMQEDEKRRKTSVRIEFIAIHLRGPLNARKSYLSFCLRQLSCCKSLWQFAPWLFLECWHCADTLATRKKDVGLVHQGLWRDFQKQGSQCFSKFLTYTLPLWRSVLFLGVFAWTSGTSALSKMRRSFFIQSTPKSGIALLVATVSAIWEVRSPNPVPCTLKGDQLSHRPGDSSAHQVIRCVGRGGFISLKPNPALIWKGEKAAWGSLRGSSAFPDGRGVFQTFTLAKKLTGVAYAGASEIPAAGLVASFSGDTENKQASPPLFGS